MYKNDHTFYYGILRESFTEIGVIILLVDKYSVFKFLEQPII